MMSLFEGDAFFLSTSRIISPYDLEALTSRHIMIDANGLSMWRINEGMEVLLKRIPGKGFSR
jgi:hypothetical protein